MLKAASAKICNGVKSWLSNGLMIPSVAIVDGEGNHTGTKDNPLQVTEQESEKSIILGYIIGEGVLTNPQLILNPPPKYEISHDEPDPLFIVPSGMVARVSCITVGLVPTGDGLVGGVFLMNGEKIEQIAISSGSYPVNAEYSEGSEINAIAKLVAGSENQGTVAASIAIEYILEDA